MATTTSTDTSGAHERTGYVSRDVDTPANVYGGPNVMVPPKNLMASTEAHQPPTAPAEPAKHNIEFVGESSPREVTPIQHPATQTTDKFAFAFDIDGVFLRGGKPIPVAVDAMKYINGENPYGVKM